MFDKTKVYTYSKSNLDLHIMDTVEHKESNDAISKFKILRRLIKFLSLNKSLLKNLEKIFYKSLR
jgi:hypothetical protein